MSGLMRVLLASKEARPRGAVELFVYRISREAGTLGSSLGGLDTFVFTAGIGENAPEIRAAVGQRLTWVSMELDEKATAGAMRSSPFSSGCSALRRR